MIGVLNSISFHFLDRLPRLELRNKGENAVYRKRLPSFKNHQSKFKNPCCFSRKEKAYSFTSSLASVLEKPEVVKNDTEEEALDEKVWISNEISKYVEVIRSMLCSMEDGKISVSAYDTAWVALIEDVNGSGTPQFPSSLEWIANNQLPDGSWGDAHVFSAYDRLLSTLACVIALKTWNLHPDRCHKGMSFLKLNLCKLQEEKAEHMTIGFEVVFPSQLEMARKLDIEVPDDLGILQDIYASRNLKLTRIPKDMIHNEPTTLLFSLEGLLNLDWEKILKLKCQEGSFFSSPSSTAFAFMQTKDENCLRYLTKTAQRFKGAVPNVFPLDFFEPNWAVDRLQRLGISRYFEAESKQCVDYVYRHWKDSGIGSGSNFFGVPNIDDTSMGFRILRLNGYQVSADVFKYFAKGGEFFCFPGQSKESVTAMFNLYRASQIQFLGENILENAKEFSSKFLREKQAANELLDKWIISKDLPGEVGYALEVPWYASLPRVEARFYIEQYGGENDIWIGKTLYRMPNVNNNLYLYLAKLDYNNCQALHCIEWENFQKWYEECNLRDFGISKRNLLFAYFLAAANLFEPERSKERLACAKTSILLETIGSFFNAENNSCEQRRAFVNEFKNGIGENGSEKTTHELVSLLLGTINHLSLDALTTHCRDARDSLHQAWEKWLLKWEMEGDRHQGEAELLVQTMILTAGCWVSPKHNLQFEQLCNLTNRLSCQLRHYQKHKAQEKGRDSTTCERIMIAEIESGMQELVQLVLQNSGDGMDSNIKQRFLAVAKSFYYTAFCTSQTINYHITKVLFERV